MNSKLVIPEFETVQVHGHTREAFLLRGAVACASVYGLASVSPFVKQAMAQGGGDVDILNFALTLEVLEQTFYERALAEVSGLSSDVEEVATQIQEDEAAHVDALTQAINDLGGTPVEAPQLDFGDAFSSESAFLELAQTLEDTGVSAYNGAAPAIESDDVLASAGSIVQIEARHAARIRQLRDEPITPAPFDEALEQDAVLEAVQPFIKS